jgi:hypothetical protein
MKRLKWPAMSSGWPWPGIPFEWEGPADICIADVGGLYRLIPKVVIENALREREQIKKAEGGKALLPAVTLCFSQTLELPDDVALVLLEECLNDK